MLNVDGLAAPSPSCVPRKGNPMKTQSIVDRSLTLLEGKTGAEQSVRFARLGFMVEPACVSLTIALEQQTRNEAQIPICLLIPGGISVS